MYQQYQSIELARDLNEVLKQGMRGVILEVWDSENYEVEFLDEDGFNYEYNGQGIFTLTSKDLTPIKTI